MILFRKVCQGLTWLSFILIILGFLAGCAEQELIVEEEASPTPVPSLTNDVAPEIIEEELRTPSPPVPEVPVTRIEPQEFPTEYFMDVIYNHQSKRVNVKQTITYQNNTGIDLNQILLVVDANRYVNGFELIEVKAEGDETIVSSSISMHRMTVTLEPALPVSEIITIHLEYNLLLPKIPLPDPRVKPQIYGYTLQQTNLVDWYPFIPPYDPDSGWILHDPSLFGEFLVYPAANFNISLTIEGSTREIVVAASSIPEVEEGIYHYRLLGARNFVFSFSPDFVEKTIHTNGLAVKGYWFSLDARAGETALEHTVAAVNLYSQLFGELPRESISIVQGDFLDGMEFDGLFFLSKGFFNTYDGTPQGFLVIIAVHETAHQWFYGLVANDQAMEPWLDEALCTYMEKIYYAHYYPELVDWWWFFRIHLNEPSGVIDLPVYDYPGFLPYRDTVYLNGAVFLEELRQEIGDEAFFAALRSYVEAGAGRIVSGDDFFAAVAKYSDKDIRPLRSKFFSE